MGALGCSLSICGVGAFGLGDDRGAGSFGGGLVVVVEQDWLECSTHVPFEMVSEHAYQHMSAHAVSAAMMDGPDFEIDGLEAAEGSLDVGEIFIGPDGGSCVERFGLDVGTQDIDAVEQGFGIDLLGLALERQ